MTELIGGLAGLGGLGAAAFQYLRSRDKKYIDQLSMAVAQIDKLTHRLDIYEEKLDKKETENELLKNQVEELLEELKKTTDTLRSVREELHVTVAKLQQAEHTISKLQDKEMENLQARVTGLEGYK